MQIIRNKHLETAPLGSALFCVISQTAYPWWVQEIIYVYICIIYVYMYIYMCCECWLQLIQPQWSKLRWCPCELDWATLSEVWDDWKKVLKVSRSASKSSILRPIHPDMNRMDWCFPNSNNTVKSARQIHFMISIWMQPARNTIYPTLDLSGAFRYLPRLFWHDIYVYISTKNMRKHHILNLVTESFCSK